jgi:hypothetical protein
MKLMATGITHGLRQTGPLRAGVSAASRINKVMQWMCKLIKICTSDMKVLLQADAVCGALHAQVAESSDKLGLVHGVRRDFHSTHAEHHFIHLKKFCWCCCYCCGRGLNLVGLERIHLRCPNVNKLTRHSNTAAQQTHTSIAIASSEAAAKNRLQIALIALILPKELAAIWLLGNIVQDAFQARTSGIKLAMLTASRYYTGSRSVPSCNHGQFGGKQQHIYSGSINAMELASQTCCRVNEFLGCGLQRSPSRFGNAHSQALA